MGMNPYTTVLVYEDGMGVYIHHLFAKRYGIEAGSDVHPSVLLKHEKEIPHEERAAMSSWIHPDDWEYMKSRGLLSHLEYPYTT